MLCIPFPTLNTSNQLKASLTKEQFFQCKNNYTLFKNNLRSILKLTNDNSKHKVGLFAVDPDCYSTFEPIFNGVLEMVHKPEKPFTYQEEDEQVVPTPFFEDIMPYVEEAQLQFYRNVDGYQFNSLLSHKHKMELNNKIMSSLQKHVQFQALVNLGEAGEFKKLQPHLEKLLKRREGSNYNMMSNYKKGLRFPDWPKNTYAGVSNEKK